MLAEILIWLFLIEVLGFIALPISCSLLKNLKDKGYAAAKALGILLFSYFAWILGHVSYSRLTIVLSAVALIFVSYFYYRKLDIRKFFVQNMDYIKKVEVLFVALFLFFVIVRAHFPAVEGLEKFSDFSIINGILRSESMPPIDSWLSGFTLDYYYFGHFMVATLTKISFLPSAVTFNLSLAMTFALLGLLSFSIGYNLTGSHKYGLLAMLLITFMSNGLGFIQMVTFISPELIQPLSDSLNLNYPLTCCSSPSASLTDNLATFPVWSSTRIVPNTINEFPYSGFLFGELHAHAMSMPFQLLFLLILLNMLLSDEKKFFSANTAGASNIILMALSLGALFFINSWDFPVYAALLLLMVAAKHANSIKETVSSAKKFIPPVVAIAVLSAILYLPFFLSDKKNTAFGLANETTSLFHFVIIFPLFLFAVFCLIYKKSDKRDFAAVAVASFLIALLTGIQILLLLLPIIYFSYRIAINSAHNERFATILFLAGALAALFTDIFFIDSRYNSVFKFYYHVWIFWSIASVYAIYSLRNRVFRYAIALLILISLPMTIFATYDRLSSNTFTLDGWKYMRDSHPADYDAVNWINQNIKEGAILEAPGDAFQYSSVFSTNTGLPTVIGWVNHELVRRGVMFTDRVNDANEIYSTTDLGKALKLAGKYNVKYIIVGNKEREKYSEGLEKFDGLNAIYNKDGIKIFSVV